MNALLAALVNGWIAGALLTAAVWLVLRMVPPSWLNAATRYILWWAVLAAVIGLPAWYLPERRPAAIMAAPVPLARRPDGFQASAHPPVRRTAAIPKAAPRAGRTVAQPAPQPVLPQPVLPQPVRTVGPPPRFTFPLAVAAGDWPKWLLGAWLLLSALLLLRLAASWVLLALRSRQASDPPEPLRSQAESWLALCGRRRIRLAVSRQIGVPVAVGPWRPSVLIPARLLETLEPGELEQVILHEVAHLARRDDYALVAQRVVEALFAPHPVVRWITRRMELERETACDDLVIAALGRPRSYATCLTRVAELSQAPASPLMVAAAGGRSHFVQRVERLLDRTRHTGTRLLRARLATAALALAVLAWTAGKAPALVAFTTPPPPRLQAAPVARIPAALPPASRPPAAETFDFEGAVVDDATSAPLASAGLKFHKAGQYELAADLETDRAGRAQAAGLAPGEYRVEISKPNYVTATLPLNVPASGLLVRLVRYGVIGGTVRNQEGQPVPGRLLLTGGATGGRARVSVLVKRPGREEFETFREATVDDNGSYRVHDLPPGQYAVGLWYSGLRDGSGMQLYPDNASPRFFSVAGGEEYGSVDFAIAPRPASRVSGRVALPKPDDRFALALGLPEQPALPVGVATTEPGGSFRFEKVPPGVYDLFVSGPIRGYGAFEWMLDEKPLFGRTRVQVTSGDVEGIDVPVGPGRSIGVVLRPHGGARARGCPQSARVTLRSIEPWGAMLTSQAQASFDAEQKVGNLAPGRYRVTASGLGEGCYAANEPVVDLGGDAAGPVAVELAAAGSVEGLLRGSAAAASVVVLLDAVSDNAQARLALPSAEGRFRFEGLRPGRYRIAAQPAGTAAKARWVADVPRMKEVVVPGGAAASVELTAPERGEP
ncbi:MAG: hypothetical protein IT158_02825 [Bryobacterales bacterium]|nr:hypothetical protein [Bryobacterales bacterium]